MKKAPRGQVEPDGGIGSYRSALERARRVSPEHIPCSWCSQPTLPTPGSNLDLCPMCSQEGQRQDAT